MNDMLPRGGSTLQPLLLSGALALATGAALYASTGEMAEPQGVWRYVANPFCVAIFAVGIWAVIYGLLELRGLRIDRSGGASRLSAWATARDGAPLVSTENNVLTMQDRAFLWAETWEATRLRRAAPTGYAIWVLPLLGFIGTVIGISGAIGGLGEVFADGDRETALQGVLAALRFAFDTTFAGLVLVIPVMALSTLIRLRSEEVRTDLTALALGGVEERV